MKKGVEKKSFSKRVGREGWQPAGKGNNSSEESDIDSSDDDNPGTCGMYMDTH